MSINNGSCWLIALFPWIYLLVHPLIAKISAELGLNFYWKTFFQLFFIGIYYAYLVQASKYFKSIHPDFNQFKLKFIHWIFPGVFLYERAELIQATYDQRLPYLEAMWWIWFLGMALMYWISIF